MTQQTDVVVIGAGVIGASCAYQLARRGLRVTVVEAEAAPAEGSTGRSFASVRAQWADSLNIELAWRSIQAYRDFERDLGVDAGYRATGYLLLIPQDRWADHLVSVRLQRDHGVPVEVLDLDDAQKITPFVPDGLGGAVWGSADGVVDPHTVTITYLKAAKELGTEVYVRAPVTAVNRVGGRWRVTIPRGEFEARHVVNAAGGWASEVAALAGLDVPVHHSRRNVYSTTELPGRRRFPMTIDTGTGVALRSEGDRVLFLLAKPGEQDGYNVSVDWDWMEQVLATTCERFPWLAEAQLDRKACWAGTYEITPDLLPFVGEHPDAPGWVNACGMCGRGVLQAPAIAQVVAEEIADGRAHSLDITPLRYERLRSSVSTPAGLVI
ncbi:FAD-binding oxidoreductase [Lentzea sp. PSKA42]|uniref:FAD-binding oxidoreductase n=1 Tax=Lentzea indica TaxID=2604800 RepID=A0ABX1FHS1_9PSEU|nr:FAD-binding oxidoreductase [Lentzea indica]NKE58177.1 FAD-binding oxidoreductase [Lentzea indica]